MKNNWLKKYIPKINDLNIYQVYKDNPDPIVQRSNFYPINAVYKLEVNGSNLIPSKFNKRINVPYSLESELSTYTGIISKKLHYHYHKEFEYSIIDSITFIHFLRIEGKFTIYLNGKEIFKGEDSIALEINVSEYIKEGLNVLDIDLVPNNKLSNGITGQVYINTSGANIIKDVNVLVNYDEKTVTFNIDSNTDNGTIKIFSPLGDSYDFEYQANVFKIPLKSFIKYYPHEPFFYQYEVKNSSSKFRGLFTIFKIEVKDVDNINFLVINDVPTKIKGVIIDDYYPYGLKTYPSFDFIRLMHNEIKNTGFNSIYLKKDLELPYFYYNALLKGLLIVNELECRNEEKFVRELNYLSKYDSNYLYIIINKSNKSDKDIYKLTKEIVKDKLVVCGPHKDINIITKTKHISKASLLLFNKGIDKFKEFINKDYLRSMSKGLVGYYYDSITNNNPLYTKDYLVRLKANKEIKQII